MLISRPVNKMYHALAHPARRQILKLLGSGPMTAGDIAERFEVSKPTMSGHFNVLKDAGLIQAERDGTTIRYRLNVSVLEEAAAAILDLVGAGGRAADPEETTHDPQRAASVPDPADADRRARPVGVRRR